MTQAERNLMMGILLLIFAIAFFALTYHFSGYELEEIPGDVGVHFFPRILLAALALQAIFLIFFSLRDSCRAVRLSCFWLFLSMCTWPRSSDTSSLQLPSWFWAFIC
jgi:hypothetical protein